MKKHYIVTLTTEERSYLKQIIQSGKNTARKITKARILLKADQSTNGPAWNDPQIAQALEVSVSTIERLRKRFVEEGLEAALNRRKEVIPRLRRKMDGHQEAQLIALVCSDPPEGRSCWSLRLLADKLVELEVVDTVSHETVRRTLKKINSNPG
jgi:transposase